MQYTSYPPDLTSPTKPPQSVMNFASTKSLPTSRAILKTDLQNRVKYDVRGLLETFLGTHLVSDSTVERCVRELKKKCTTQFEDLKSLADDGREKREKEMYEPLVRFYNLNHGGCPHNKMSPSSPYLMSLRALVHTTHDHTIVGSLRPTRRGLMTRDRTLHLLSQIS